MCDWRREQGHLLRGLPEGEGEVRASQTKGDGEEDTLKKRVAEESPQGKKQPKKARMELEVALSMEAAGGSISELERVILWRLD